MTKKKSCNLDKEINDFIAQKIALAKHIRNLTYKNMSICLNISMQQSQKYCKGTNRISAAKLFTFATTFNFPMDFFFPKEKKDNNTRNMSYDVYELKRTFDEFNSKQKIEFLSYCINNLAYTGKISLEALND